MVKSYFVWWTLGSAVKPSPELVHPVFPLDCIIGSIRTFLSDREATIYIYNTTKSLWNTLKNINSFVNDSPTLVRYIASEQEFLVDFF